jgi:ribonuclease P protein component
MSALPLSDSPLPPAAGAAALRFGITVSRRQARRAVARNAVKRVLREAARQRAPVLEAALAGQCVDVLFRLKAPLPESASAGWNAVKAQLRREADSLLEQLLDVLRAGGKIVGPPYRMTGAAAPRGRETGPSESLAQSTSAPQSMRQSPHAEAGAAAQTQSGARPASTIKPAGA